MQILIKNIKEILDKDIDLVQRGILITILLVKDNNPKFTLAKLKAEIKISSVKEDLIKLQDRGFIKWSGYKAAKKALDQKYDFPKVIEVIDFMNHLYGRNFNHHSEGTIKNLRNRLEEHDVETVKAVAANRYEEWKDDPVMKKHLEPTTIFRPSKFDKYLEATLRTKKGMGIVNANKIGLEDGEGISPSQAATFIDSDNYTIRTYDINSNGTRLGMGVKSTVKGSDIKILIKTQVNRVNRGDLPEFVYTYQTK